MFAPIARLIKQRQAAAAVRLEAETSGLTEQELGKRGDFKQLKKAGSSS
jgi:hypothetical protein